MQIHQKQEGDLSLVPPQAVENFCLITILAAKTKKNLNKPSQIVPIKIQIIQDFTRYQKKKNSHDSMARSSCSILSLQKETKISKSAASN